MFSVNEVRRFTKSSNYILYRRIVIRQKEYTIVYYINTFLLVLTFYDVRTLFLYYST